MFFGKKAEEEKEGVRKKVASFERNKLMWRNEVDLDQFSSVLSRILLDIDAERPSL